MSLYITEPDIQCIAEVTHIPRVEVRAAVDDMTHANQQTLKMAFELVARSGGRKDDGMRQIMVDLLRPGRQR